MNRAERRRHDRVRSKQPVIVLGDNAVAASLGQYFEPKQGAELPTKKAGEHRWIAVAAFVVPTPGMIDREDVLKILGPHNMLSLGIGCYDCEQPWTASIGDCPAPGDPS